MQIGQKTTEKVYMIYFFCNFVLFKYSGIIDCFFKELSIHYRLRIRVL